SPPGSGGVPGRDLRSGTDGNGHGARAPAGRAAHLGSVPPDGPGGAVRRRGRCSPWHAGRYRFQGEEQRQEAPPGGAAPAGETGAIMMSCPSPEMLQRLLADQLSGAEEQAAGAHVEACSLCQQVLETLTAFGDTVP